MSGLDIGLIFIPMLTGLIAALACALLGNFLVLRHESLIGDAISHVVLPGIVIAFVLTGSRATLPMLLGAASAAVIAAILIKLIERYGRVEKGAAMGVVFTSLFAFGVLLLENTSAGDTHFDVEHALYGSLETIVWFDGFGWASFLDLSALATLPHELSRLFIVLILSMVFIFVAWRPLIIASLDADFAHSQGINPHFMGLILTIFVAIVSVAAFDAVGAIITIAMLICPPAAARLYTDQLGVQLPLSLLFASLAAISGYWLAGAAPALLGINASVSAAGMIATIAGLIVFISAMIGPKRKSVLR